MSGFGPRLLRHLALLACSTVALAGASACESTTPPTTPTTEVQTTETFSGSLSKNGAATFPFAVGKAGTVTASLQSLEPDDSVVVGFALGTWNGTSCNIVLANDAASQGAVIIGAATSAGALCLRIQDVGNLTAATTYTLTVVHP